MAILSWSEQYLVGNKTIDDEHKELFNLINQFHTDWVETQDRQVIARVLNRLVDYAERHFQHEEAIMAEAGYPMLTEHQKVHEMLFDKIFNLHQDYVRNDLRLEIGMVKFLKNWLVDHILENDYLFRDFLKKHPAADKPAEPLANAEP